MMLCYYYVLFSPIFNSYNRMTYAYDDIMYYNITF